MPLPDAVLRVAELAPGKRVTVTAGGKSYTLPERPEIVAPTPDPLQVAASRLLDSDAQSRALLENVSRNFAEVFGRVDETVSALAAGHAEVVKSVQENTRTLHLPVKPVYDKDGKVIAAQRVKS